MKTLLITFAILCASFTDIYSATYYWVGKNSNQWNDVNNWSTYSGGPSAGVIPGIYDAVFIDGGAKRTLKLNANQEIESLWIFNGSGMGPDTLDLSSYTLTISGVLSNSCIISDAIVVGDSIGKFKLESNVTITIKNSYFSVLTDFLIKRKIDLEGSSFIENSKMTFNGTPSYITITKGGNYYNKDLYVENIGSGATSLGEVYADTVMGNLSLVNNGTHNMSYAYNSSGHYVKGDVLMDNNGKGSTKIIQMHLAPFANSEMTVDGDVNVLNQGSSSHGRVDLAQNGKLTIKGSVKVQNTYTGPAGTFSLAFTQGSYALIKGDLIVSSKFSSYSHFYVNLADYGNATIEGDLELDNAATNAGYNYLGHYQTGVLKIYGKSYINNHAQGQGSYVGIALYGRAEFLGGLEIDNSGNSPLNTIDMSRYPGAYTELKEFILSGNNTNIYGLFIGRDGGTTLIDSGAIRTTAVGYLGKDVLLKNVVQQAGDSNLLKLDPLTKLEIENCSFEGSLTINTGGYLAKRNNFLGGMDLDITGSISSSSYGGNRIDDHYYVNMAGTGSVTLARNAANDVNGDSRYVQSAGWFYPASIGRNTISGDMEVDVFSNTQFGQNGGYMIFDGDSDQVFSNYGSGNGARFYGVEISNNGGRLHARANMSIQYYFIMNSGLVFTDDVSAIQLERYATATNVSDVSHVVGWVSKQGNAAFTFPIGDTTYLKSLSITAPASADAQFKARHLSENPRLKYSEKLRDTSIQNITDQEYWLLEREVSTSDVYVTLNWNANSNLDQASVLADMSIAHWKSSLGRWVDEGNGGVSGNVTKGQITSGHMISSFSPFTLGVNTTTNTLPVELLYFNAKYDEHHGEVNLSWATSSEINNSHFTIWKSSDNKEFTELATVNGQGTYNGHSSYNDLDFEPVDGYNYYRLTQTDFDGSITYYNIRVVNVEKKTSEAALSVYPNPVKALGNITLSLSNVESNQLSVSIIDQLGRVLPLQYDYAHVDSHIEMNIQLDAELVQGHYILQVKTDTDILSSQLIIN